mmetsp:Transcript_3409/g.10412  ORF Transcript_3409/g.10412 Transcript_3409/m.10412 type:complete len:263 (-) Transcript_3409:278-1066(-)
MAGSREEKWAAEQAAAEQAREAARARLADRGQVVDATSAARAEQIHGVAALDNTLQLIRERNAAAAAAAARQAASGSSMFGADSSESAAHEARAKLSHLAHKTPGGPTSLPEDWKVVETNQDTYFRHRPSGCCCIDQPPEGRDAAALASLSIPPPWKALQDPASGKFYFWHPASNAVQWEVPVPAAPSFTIPCTSEGTRVARPSGTAAATASALGVKEEAASHAKSEPTPTSDNRDESSEAYLPGRGLRLSFKKTKRGRPTS